MNCERGYIISAGNTYIYCFDPRLNNDQSFLNLHGGNTSRHAVLWHLKLFMLMRCINNRRPMFVTRVGLHYRLMTSLSLLSRVRALSSKKKRVISLYIPHLDLSFWLIDLFRKHSILLYYGSSGSLPTQPRSGAFVPSFNRWIAWHRERTLAVWDQP